MTAHTPGPWVITPHPTPNVDVFGVGEVMDDKETQYALSHTICYQNAEANARLIAAAPELLDVAQRSAAALVSAGVESNASSDNPLEWLLHMTLAAIAKAKGESDGR